MFLKFLIRMMRFLEFIGTILQDLVNSWIPWLETWQDSYQEIQEYPRFLSRVPRVFTLGSNHGTEIIAQPN